MTPFILMLCLGVQEADSSSQGTQKAVQSEEVLRRDNLLRLENLDALLKKVNALEAELKELKAAPRGSQDKEKPADTQAQSEEEKKRKQLEEEFKKALGQEKPAPKMNTQVTGGTPIGGGATLKLIDIAFDLLAVGGTSSATEAEIRLLEAGGHDPKNRGFTVQNVELTFSGVVDPYLRGDANIVLQIDDNGDTTIELEEAYLTTLEFPYNLQFKAGQFFNAFGRLNPIHPHAWEFVDQPIINSRVLGHDGFRGPGAQLSWLTPLPFFAELTGSIQNSQGETAVSFRNSPGEVVAGRTLVARPVRTLEDMVYLIRLKTSFDPSEEITIVPGISALFGPNATDLTNRTQIYGADFYLKWKPLANDQGWPFVGWQSEVMCRRYGAAAVLDPGGVEIDRERVLIDWGVYSQVVWGFARPWVMGFRLDYAKGQRDSYDDGAGLTYNSMGDSFRDQRGRASINLTYYPSEFSKVRLQYNYDRSEFLSKAFSDPKDAHSIWLQFEILFGAHGAHKF
jgi:hypothetical protein